MLKARCYRLASLLFGGNHILVIFAQNICIRNCFFGLKMQNSPCPGRDTPPPRPSPARSLRSLAILLADYFRRVSETYVQNFHLVLFNSWWIAWKLLWKNCHKSIQNKVDIALYRVSRIPELPGPLSGPWTHPGRNSGYMLQPQRRRSWGAGGAAAPQWKYWGANISFCPPPPIISTTWKINNM